MSNETNEKQSKPTIEIKTATGARSRWHVFEDEMLWALDAAIATEKPLLIRGEPGVGKSQLACAAAQKFNRIFLSHVITAETESTDVFWRFDAVARLARAQLESALHVDPKDRAKVEENLRQERFLTPECLWWAYNWDHAARHARTFGIHTPQNQSDETIEHVRHNGCVVLIDEIDKAEADLPNGLLQCFADQCFEVPYIEERIVRRDPDQVAPLLIVTTNEERELPPAFIRRCLVLNLQLPDVEKEKEEFTNRLVERAYAHYYDEFGKNDKTVFDTIVKKCITYLITDRKTASREGLALPGQAEYLDLVLAVFELAKEKDMSPDKVLEQVKNFALKKNPPRGND